MLEGERAGVGTGSRVHPDQTSRGHDPGERGDREQSGGGPTARQGRATLLHAVAGVMRIEFGSHSPLPSGARSNTPHVDFMWPMWGVFDRAPEGRGEWEPKLEYA